MIKSLLIIVYEITWKLFSSFKKKKRAKMRRLKKETRRASESERSNEAKPKKIDTRMRLFTSRAETEKIEEPRKQTEEEKPTPPRKDPLEETKPGDRELFWDAFMARSRAGSGVHVGELD